MPPYVKNTGMSSLNELFAMKKNLAYETKFEHRLSGINRDLYNKKENLKQEIRAVYNELKMIKSSTGHSLNQAQSDKKEERPFRKPNIPAIYLPPIGVRLVKKYIGIDVKRNSLVTDDSPVGQHRTLDSILNRTIGLSKTENVRKTAEPKNGTNTTRKVGFLVDSADALDVEIEDNQKNVPVLDELNVEIDQPVIHTTFETFPATTENRALDIPLLQRNEKLLDETTIFKLSDFAEHKFEEVCNTEEDISESTNDLNEKEGMLLVETDYNFTERRSSRSTFRGRSSARLPSRSHMLSEYNLGVVALSKGNNKQSKKKPSQKKDVGNFYLDYGDGKLHDNMEIPKMKDCSRPWCNPHCKTCRNRTFSRPCFVLIPAEENVRKRKIPQDKRRASVFPVYLASQRKTLTACSFEDTDGNGETIQPFTRENTVTSEELRNTNADDTENKDLTGDLTEREKGEANNDEKNDKSVLKTGENMQQNNAKPRKGYSKKRIEELSQPRGGPPAEVRFSKWSLRRKQEELVEDERRKALTEYERQNLTNIQGRISVYLALLNEQEIMNKPVKMVDIPVRMDVVTRDTSKNKQIKQKRQRNASFNTRPRLLS